MENKENRGQKRSRNFTDYDKNVLFEITLEHKDIIENKKTDATNVKLKNETWDIIAEKFNANCQTGSRSAKQLHALYDGMKKKARKTMQDDKKELHKTGGGFFTPNSDIMDIKIIETMKDQFKSLANVFDSSTTYLDNVGTDKCQENETTNFNTQHLELDIKHEICEKVKEDKTDDNSVFELQPSLQVVVTPSRTKIGGASTSSELPERTPSKHALLSPSTSTGKKENYLKKITNRLVEPKNHKGENDKHLYNKKLAVLTTEEQIKIKELEIKSIELDHIKLKNEMELKFLEMKQGLELKLLEIDVKIKEAQLKQSL